MSITQFSIIMMEKAEIEISDMSFCWKKCHPLYKRYAFLSFLKKPDLAAIIGLPFLIYVYVKIYWKSEDLVY